jgi:thiol-disulfide isomerase/thioredoxin
MKSFTILLCLLVVGIATGCSTSNQGVAVQPDWPDHETFSVTVEEGGVGTFTPAINVAEDAAGATITVTAENASDLAAAYVNISYDSRRFTPASVEAGSFLGRNSEVISLAVTEIPGSVPFGVAQVVSSGVRPVDGSGTIAVMRFDAQPFNGNRAVSQSPQGSANAVADLQITNHVGDDYTLQWTEKNTGDYDNNSLVGIADLTPLGQLIGTSVATAPDQDWARLVDGNGDGAINISDITPIGANFGNKMDGYILYADGSAVGSGITVLRGAQNIDPKKAVRYIHSVNMAGAPEFVVRPASTAEVTAPGPPSNPAVVNIDTEAPDAPFIESATAGESVGNRTVHLTFTSSSSDVEKFQIDSKLSSADDSSWLQVVDQPKGSFEAVSPTLFAIDIVDQTFSDVSYDFRVRALDEVNNVSENSNVASATPFVPAGPPAPTGAGAVPSTSTSLAIDLSWSSPVANDLVEGILGYRIYRQQAGGGFSLLNTVSADGSSSYSYTDQGLTIETDYDYYFVSLAPGPTESAPSGTVSSQCSIASPIEILDITTDKWTHHINGDNGAVSNLEVITDSLPDDVEWDAPIGTIVGSGGEVQWQPGNGMPVGTVDIEVTVHSGSNSDSGTISLIITSLSIKTFHVDRGDASQNPLGTAGHYNDLDLTGFQYLGPLAHGGTIGAATGTLADLVDGKVWMADSWELWCGPCKAEFPELDDYAQAYEADGYMQMSISDDTGAAYQLPNILTWFEQNDIDYCHQLFLKYSASTPQVDQWRVAHGYDYYIPYNILFDKDGFARKTGGQAFGWDVDIAQLCGVAVK